MNSRPDPFSLDGKIAVVTGGYGVLGGSIASGLAAAGASVAILGRRRESAERKADEIRQLGGEARALVADVLDEPSSPPPATSCSLPGLASTSSSTRRAGTSRDREATTARCSTSRRTPSTKCCA